MGAIELIAILAQFVARYMRRRTDELDELYWHACLLREFQQ